MDKELAPNTRRKLQEEFKQRLFELGLLPEITPPLPADAIDMNRQPIPIEGKPVSEVIIEERR
jgi:hypothetical protein